MNKAKLKAVAWSFLRAAWQLLSYLTIGIVPFIPSAILYFFNKAKGIVFLLRVDISVCLMAHGINRTISGLTGERSKKYNRYYFQELVIDVLAYPFEKRWRHCKRVNEIEQLRFKRYKYYVKVK